VPVLKLVRWLAIAVLIAVTVVVLFLYVFPWVEERTQDPTLEGAAGGVPVATAQLVRAPR
jgi:lipopolysaccharide export LptBFGC system permease protein LptF